MSLNVQTSVSDTVSSSAELKVDASSGAGASMDSVIQDDQVATEATPPGLSDRWSSKMFAFLNHVRDSGTRNMFMESEGLVRDVVRKFNCPRQDAEAIVKEYCCDHEALFSFYKDTGAAASGAGAAASGSAGAATSGAAEDSGAATSGAAESYGAAEAPSSASSALDSSDEDTTRPFSSFSAEEMSQMFETIPHQPELTEEEGELVWQDILKLCKAQTPRLFKLQGRTKEMVINCYKVYMEARTSSEMFVDSLWAIKALSSFLSKKTPSPKSSPARGTKRRSDEGSDGPKRARHDDVTLAFSVLPEDVMRG